MALRDAVEEILVSRFERFPRRNPAGYVTGYTVTLTNGRSKYFDLLIADTDSRLTARPEPEEYRQIALADLKSSMATFVREKGTMDPIVGSVLPLDDVGLPEA